MPHTDRIAPVAPRLQLVEQRVQLLRSGRSLRRDQGADPDAEPALLVRAPQHVEIRQGNRAVPDDADAGRRVRKGGSPDVTRGIAVAS